MIQGGISGSRSARSDGRRAVARAGWRSHPGRACDVAGARQPGRFIRPADQGTVARPAPGGGQPAGQAVRAAQGTAVRRGGRPPGHPAARVPVPGDGRRTGRVAIRAARGRGRHGAGGRRRRHRGRRLDEALALWRGPALAGLDAAPFARAEAGRLEEERLAALESRAEALLACGRHRDLIADLETLTAAHPLRERFWRQRMLALYRAGRQADALRAYRKLRDALIADLGIEPAPELRVLHTRMLRQDPGLDFPVAPAAGGESSHGSAAAASGEVPQTRYAQTSDGIHIAYQVLGRGERDIVFVPGLMSHLELLWEDQQTSDFFRRLSALGRLILFDKRDTGLSDRAQGDMSLEERIERMAVSPSAFLRMLRMIHDIDVRAALPAIHVPTLVIQRLGDRITPPGHGRYLASHTAGARYFEQPGDHSLRFAASGDTEALYAEIAGFVAGLPPRREPARVLATILHAQVTGGGQPAEEAVRHLVGAHRGRLIEAPAEVLLATFDAPGQAIRCAAAVLDHAAALGVKLSAGIHTGEVDLAGDALTGTAVQIASRVAALARPAEILVSRTVKDLVTGSGISFTERGSYELNGEDEQWAL